MEIVRSGTGKAHACPNDHPHVYSSSAKTPADALRALADILDRDEHVWLTALNITYYEEDDSFGLTAYI